MIAPTGDLFLRNKKPATRAGSIEDSIKDHKDQGVGGEMGAIDRQIKNSIDVLMVSILTQVFSEGQVFRYYFLTNRVYFVSAINTATNICIKSAKPIIEEWRINHASSGACAGIV